MIARGSNGTVFPLRAVGRALPTVVALATLLLQPSPASGQTESESVEKHEKTEDILARAKARRARRLDGSGRLAEDALIEARRQMDERWLNTGRSKLRDGGIWNWDWLGPGNIGGRVRCIVIHPTNPSIMFAGTAGGGIWRTLDGGSGWWPMSDYIAALPVASLAMDPVNSSIIYAGTGELVGSNSSIPGAGIYRSTNLGLTWTQLAATDNSNFRYVSELAHHPTISGTLLAGTATGLWRSTDSGDNWTRILFPPNGAAVRDVDYHPTIASTIAAGTETDMYLSTNGGSTFVSQTTGASGKMPVNPGDCEIAFAPSNPNILYVSAGKDVPVLNDLTDWIYRSTNSGSTWSTFMPTNADRWSNALWVSPNNPNIVVWGGFGDLFRTLNGTTYSRISEWTRYVDGLSAHADQHAIVAHPDYDGASNRTVFFGNDGGVQKATDVTTVSQTSGWTNLANNLGCSQFFSVSGATDGSIIIGGTQDNGSLRYRPADGEQGWFSVSGGDGIYCAVDPTNPQRFFVTAQFLWVGRSDDGGAHVDPKMNGLAGAGNGRFFDFLAPLVLNPNNPNVLWAGGKKIWKTTNAGDFWSSKRDSLPPAPGPYCTAIDVARSNPDVVWIGYSNGLVSHTSDGGTSWIDHWPPPGRWITDIAINPYAWNEVVVTFGGYDSDTIWYTNSAGISWESRHGQAPYDLPDIQVNTVRYHPIQPDWIYIGTDLGVFASEDKGITWGVTPAGFGNEGPNNVEVDELSWQGTTYLLAATHGRGIYRCTPLDVVYVDLSYSGFEDGSVAHPFNTVAEAVAAYGPGALVSIRSGTYNEPPLLIDKRGWIEATDGPVRIQ